MNRLDALVRDPVIGPYLPELNEKVAERNDAIFHHNKKGIALASALEKLPDVHPSSTDANRARIRIGTSDDLNENQSASLYEALCDLKPWRKGPFEIFGIRLDSEWDSSIKWNRLADHLGSLAGQRVLDIGSSCGYYMFRLAMRQAALIMGIEPAINFYFQFLALDRYLGFPHVHGLPLTLEAMPDMHGCFDTVLCMGILYHRRSPLDTLLRIHRLLAPGGMIVLETLILEADGEIALFPQERYAKMNNVFFIPTLTCLTHWLTRCGFDRIQTVAVSKTNLKEQRKTEWIDTQSLADFLDPENPHQTVEGYPAPVRAMVLATSRHR